VLPGGQLRRQCRDPGVGLQVPPGAQVPVELKRPMDRDQILLLARLWVENTLQRSAASTFVFLPEGSTGRGGDAFFSLELHLYLRRTINKEIKK